MKSILEEGFEAQAKAMREFGYPDASAEMIKKHHDAWLKGEDPQGVIAMFSVQAFKEYPQIFGEK